MLSLSDFFYFLRAKSWVKNIFIFLPLFFSAQLFDSQKLIQTCYVFIGFSLACSCIYIINDVFDKEYDAKHPTKKNRPIAANKISIKAAIFIATLLLFASFSILYFVSKLSLYFTIFYVILNLFYSFKLKHIPIIDFFVVSIGFVIRILIGGYSNDIELSQWIIIMTFLLSIFIAVSKRRDDVFQYEENNKINRKVVELYTVSFMDRVITIISSVLIVSYLLFITSPEVIERYNSDYLLFTFLFVVLGIIRYNYITYVFNKSGSPIKILFNDRFLQIVVLLWIINFFLIIYK